MTELEQEKRMLMSGALGPELSMPEMIAMDLVSREACEWYLKEIGASATIINSDLSFRFICQVAINDNITLTTVTENVGRA